MFATQTHISNKYGFTHVQLCSCECLFGALLGSVPWWRQSQEEGQDPWLQEGHKWSQMLWRKPGRAALCGKRPWILHDFVLSE